MGRPGGYEFGAKPNLITRVANKSLLPKYDSSTIFVYCQQRNHHQPLRLALQK